MNKPLIITLLLSIFLYNCKTVVTNPKIIALKLNLIEKTTGNPIQYSLIEIYTGNKKLTIQRPTIDGELQWKVCTKKLANNTITLKIYAANCNTTEHTITLTEDQQYNIVLPKGKAPFGNNQELNNYIRTIGAFQDQTLHENEEEKTQINAKYQHCDGRIKHYNDIPKKEIDEWRKIKNN